MLITMDFSRLFFNRVALIEIRREEETENNKYCGKIMVSEEIAAELLLAKSTSFLFHFRT